LPQGSTKTIRRTFARVRTADRTRIGRYRLSRLTPLARSATSSLSDDSRPMAISTPNRSAIGMVRTTMFGSDRRRSSPTVATGRPRRMIISAASNRASSSRMKV
jgi:hypothetical protein